MPLLCDNSAISAPWKSVQDRYRLQAEQTLPAPAGSTAPLLQDQEPVSRAATAQSHRRPKHEDHRSSLLAFSKLAASLMVQIWNRRANKVITVTDLTEQDSPAYDAAVPMLSQFLKAEIREVNRWRLGANIHSSIANEILGHPAGPKVLQAGQAVVDAIAADIIASCSEYKRGDDMIVPQLVYLYTAPAR